MSEAYMEQSGPLLEQIISVIKEQNFEFWNSAVAFIDAVNWAEERWLQALLALHLCTLILVIYTRRNFTVQCVLFFTLCGMVYLAQMLNGVLHSHWESFSTQDYFDSSGLFLSVVYSGPLMLILVFVLGNMLIAVSSMLIHVKRKEIAQQRKQKKKESERKQD